ncbi:unnamed protein product, partial [Trichogramma brassicae]
VVSPASGRQDVKRSTPETVRTKRVHCYPMIVPRPIDAHLYWGELIMRSASRSSGGHGRVRTRAAPAQRGFLHRLKAAVEACFENFRSSLRVPQEGVLRHGGSGKGCPDVKPAVTRRAASPQGRRRSRSPACQSLTERVPLLIAADVSFHNGEGDHRENNRRSIDHGGQAENDGRRGYGVLARSCEAGQPSQGGCSKLTGSTIAGSSVKNIRRSAAGALELQLKKGVENAPAFGEELGKVLGTAATASALLHTSMIEIKDLDECDTKEEVTMALDALLGIPVSKRDPVKSLRKAYAGTQGAVVAIPDDLAATALKLGHVQIGWVNCRIRAREEAARCYRCWSPVHVAAHCKGPDRALLSMRPEGPPGKGTAKANHHAFSAKNEELTTIVTGVHKLELSSCTDGDHSGPPMMRILQLNLNHCEAAQDLLCDTISKLRIDVAILCEQYKNLAPPNTWLADADGQAAIWVHGGIPVQEHPARVHPYFAWARIGGIFVFSVYAAPRLSEMKFSALLPTSRRRPAAEGPCVIAGELKRMVDGVGM